MNDHKYRDFYSFLRDKTPPPTNNENSITPNNKRLLSNKEIVSSPEDSNKKPKISNQSQSNLNQIDIKERSAENILKKVSTFIGTIEQPTKLSHFGPINTLHIGYLMAPIILHKDTTLLKIDHLMPNSKILKADSLQEIEIKTVHSNTSINLSHLPSLKSISIEIEQLQSLIILPNNCKKTINKL